MITNEQYSLVCPGFCLTHVRNNTDIEPNQGGLCFVKCNTKSRCLIPPEYFINFNIFLISIEFPGGTNYTNEGIIAK